MAYNENNVQRIREVLQQKNADFYEKKMFGGICFMVNDKICCATRIDKKIGEEVLLCRVDELTYEDAIQKDYVIPMGSGGRMMKGFIFVAEAAWISNKSLNHWIQLCLDFNPSAKASKKKKS